MDTMARHEAAQEPAPKQEVVATEDNQDTPEARHLLLLPPNLAALAKLTAKDGHARFSAISGVRLASTVRGYRAEAINGKYLGIVTGPMPAEVKDYPELSMLKDAPNSATNSIVATADWAEAFKLIPKKIASKAILGNLATVLGEKVTTFGATDLTKSRCEQCANLDGRFPDTAKCLPQKSPLASVRIDAALLIELLKVAMEYTDSSTPNAVILELHGKEPVVVRTKNSDGQEFTGVIVPLTN